jgi:hypothetical protein
MNSSLAIASWEELEIRSADWLFRPEISSIKKSTPLLIAPIGPTISWQNLVHNSSAIFKSIVIG